MALSKTGRFLSKAEILGVGVFSLLSISGHRRRAPTAMQAQGFLDMHGGVLSDKSSKFMVVFVADEYDRRTCRDPRLLLMCASRLLNSPRGLQLNDLNSEKDHPNHDML